MRKKTILVLLTLFTTTNLYATTIPDLEITNTLVYQSSSHYIKSVGKCPCPYSWDDNGQPCGTKSAWWQNGGSPPICYPSDVNSEMISEYREEQGQVSQDDSGY